METQCECYFSKSLKNSFCVGRSLTQKKNNYFLLLMKFSQLNFLTWDNNFLVCFKTNKEIYIFCRNYFIIVIFIHSIFNRQ